GIRDFHVTGVQTCALPIWRHDGDVVLDHHLTRLGQLAVATALPRQVDDHAARLHALHGFRGDQRGRLAAGYLRGGDHHVEPGDRLVEPARLLGPLPLGQPSGHAAFAYRLTPTAHPRPYYRSAP